MLNKRSWSAKLRLYPCVGLFVLYSYATDASHDWMQPILFAIYTFAYFKIYKNSKDIFDAKFDSIHLGEYMSINRYINERVRFSHVTNQSIVFVTGIYFFCESLANKHVFLCLFISAFFWFLFNVHKDIIKQYDKIIEKSHKFR